MQIMGDDTEIAPKNDANFWVGLLSTYRLATLFSFLTRFRSFFQCQITPLCVLLCLKCSQITPSCKTWKNL